MGHLINPVAYRLGHTRSWEDSWFVKNIYYPEFLHSVLKIRKYIYYYWTTRFMEKKGILFSHLSIYKFLKYMLIKIFLYNTDMEKYVYAFYAKGIGVFSDSFYYRIKRKKKKKFPFRYQRYKPDLFFLLFLYYSYFTRLKIKRKKKIKKAFFFVNNLARLSNKKFNFNANLNKKNNFYSYDRIVLNKKVKLSFDYLNALKNSELDVFFDVPDKKEMIRNKRHLSIPAYENKIEQLSIKKLNMGLLDFLIYVFFKINTLEKSKEDLIRNKKKRRSVEMILNYPLKLQQLKSVLDKYLKLNIKLEKKRRRSVSNFYFFLTFIIKAIFKMKKNHSRANFKLREFNLRLIRLFLFNRVYTKFAFFYGKFLGNVLNILTKIKDFSFKFCFISNNSVNAKFLTRYIGLKLKKKFPLFTVINPLKKELKKLARKKKEKKKKRLYYDSIGKSRFNTKLLDYKTNFFLFVKYLSNKYLEALDFYFNKNSILITFDLYTFFFILKKKYKDQMLLVSLRNKFSNIWKIRKKKRYINKKWIFFLFFLLKKNIYKSYLIKKKRILCSFYSYIKNKLLINLFFSSNKYDLDSIVTLLVRLRGDQYTFFFLNSEYIMLTVYSFFFNYSVFDYTLFRVNYEGIITSNFFLKTFTFHMYVQYSFNKLIDYLNINKKKHYLKTKTLYESSSFILGYKMSFKGRFTRKQRASSVWFHQGFVPLNTIKGCIDYSFFTIPLKNSAVSIKLWLYKNTNKVIWDSKFIDKIY